MRIQLKNTTEQIALIKAMASKDDSVAIKARIDFAAAIGPVIQQVLNLMRSSALLYTDWQYNEDDNPTFPLDQYYGTNVDHVTVWAQSVAGGAGSSLLGSMQEMPLSTWPLSTAWSFLVKNLQRGRLPSLSLGLNRAAQETAAKIDRNLWVPVFKALAEARSNGADHIISATTANLLQPDDLNRLITLGKRINTAFNGGTPTAAYSKGATDLFLSPEMMESIRALAYQPVNTRAVPNTDESTAVPLPDSVREEIYRAASVPTFYGKNLVELLEFGTGQVYNALFGVYATEQSISFTAASDEIILAADTSRQAIIRPIATNGEGAEFVAVPDDQFTKRSGKVGFFANQEMGAVVLDSRTLSGIIV